MNKLFLTQQIITTLLASANKIQCETDKKNKDITVRQFMTLLAIEHLNSKDTSYSNIAHKLGTTKQNAKQLVIGLEKRGYVTCIGSESDKRASNVLITEEGKRVGNVYLIEGNMFLDEVSSSFTENELEILWNLLKKLYSFDGKEFNGFEKNVNLIK